jgi:pentatricopeptide repeat protein
MHCAIHLFGCELVRTSSQGNQSAFCLFQGVEPVLRTYNTLIIACNMCNQPREAMAVHRRMLNEGYMPNATTYNALISAYGKAGQLDKVMEVRMPVHLDQSHG